MKDILQLVSGAVAFITSPEVAIAAIVGWFGHVFWSRYALGRRDTRKSEVENHSDLIDEKRTDVAQEPKPSIEAEPQESRLSDEVIPSRIADEIILPILRQASDIVRDIKDRGLICSEDVRWKGAKYDGTTWYDEVYQFSKFPDKMPGASRLVEVTIGLHVTSISNPPQKKILEWEGYFLSEKEGVSGSWTRSHWNRKITSGADEDPIPAYNIGSVVQMIKVDVDALLEKWDDS